MRRCCAGLTGQPLAWPDWSLMDDQNTPMDGRSPRARSTRPRHSGHRSADIPIARTKSDMGRDIRRDDPRGRGNERMVASWQVAWHRAAVAASGGLTLGIIWWFLERVSR